jgi:hypothetical protein
MKFTSLLLTALIACAVEAAPTNLEVRNVTTLELESMPSPSSQSRFAPNADVKGYANGPDSYWVRDVEVRRSVSIEIFWLDSHPCQQGRSRAPNADVKGYANGPDSYWVRRDIEVTLFCLMPLDVSHSPARDRNAALAR